MSSGPETLLAIPDSLSLLFTKEVNKLIKERRKFGRAIKKMSFSEYVYNFLTTENELELN